MHLRALLVVFSFLTGQATVPAQGSRNAPAIRRSTPDLRWVTDVSVQDKIGRYQSGRLVGESLTLDSTLHFRSGQYACVGPIFSDTGRWRVYPTGRIDLRSAGGIRIFEIVHFNHYCFCIPPAKRSAFVRDFIKLRKKYGRLKTVHFEDRVLTAADVIAYELMNDYYGRDLDPWN
jgi:hypothetical protein